MEIDKPALNERVEALRLKTDDQFSGWAIEGALRALADTLSEISNADNGQEPSCSCPDSNPGNRVCWVSIRQSGPASGAIPHDLMGLIKPNPGDQEAELAIRYMRSL
jgi:hypothetical protein